MTNQLARFLVLPLGLGMSFLMHLLLARALEAADYGQLSILLSATTLVALLLGLGLPNAAQKFVQSFRSSEDGDNLDRFQALLLAWLCGLLAIGLVAHVGARTYLPTITGIAAAALAPLLMMSVLAWTWQRYVCLGNGRVLLALIPRDLLVPMLVIAWLWLSPDAVTIDTVVWIYASLTLVLCLSVYLVISARPAIRGLRLLDWRHTRQWLVSGWSFLVTSVLQLGLNNWDILILGALASLQETGNYALAMRIASIVLVVQRVTNTYFGHRFAHFHAIGDRPANLGLFARCRRASVAAGFALVIALAIGLPWLHDWMGENFGAVLQLAAPLLLANLLILALGPSMFLLTMSGQEALVAKSALGWTALSIVANLVLVPAWGAWAAVAVYTVSNLGMRYRLYRHVTQYASPERED